VFPNNCNLLYHWRSIWIVIARACKVLVRGWEWGDRREREATRGVKLAPFDGAHRIVREVKVETRSSLYQTFNKVINQTS
jgi:hypothetical protein